MVKRSRGGRNGGREDTTTGGEGKGRRGGGKVQTRKLRGGIEASEDGGGNVVNMGSLVDGTLGLLLR